MKEKFTVMTTPTSSHFFMKKKKRYSLTPLIPTEAHEN